MGLVARSFWYAVATGSKTEQRVVNLIEPVIEDLGYELVRARLMAAPRRTLQVMVEPGDHESQMTVEACAEISQMLSAILDVEDPIGGAYDLEVSSPGLDRPLVKLEHFERFEGFEARVETGLPIDGQKRFRGRLRGVSGGKVVLDTEGVERTFAVEDIRKAKLVLNDELLGKAER